MEKYDLIVVGGGFSGVAAAIAASEKGMRVLLVERSNALSGAANVNLVLPFMRYWTEKDGKRELLSAGLFKRICDELSAAGAMNGDFGIIFNDELLKLVLNRMAIRAGVKLLFNTTVTGVEKDGEKLQAVTAYAIGQTFTLTADYFIDATGDGNLAALAGVPFAIGREEDGLCQPMTLCFRLGNLHPEKFPKDMRKRLTEEFVKDKEAGKIGNPREDILMFNTSCPTVMHFNTTRVVKLDPISPFGVTEAELIAREQVFELLPAVRRVPGFEDACVLSTAASIGVRESRRIIGKHILTAEELKSCCIFDDSIAVGDYDIDIHNPAGAGTDHYYFEMGTYYSIPYGSLVPASGAENLLVAGRCISATHEAQASIRIMPICATLGEAAGLAALQAKKENASSFAHIRVRALQELLEGNGARIR